MKLSRCIAASLLFGAIGFAQAQSIKPGLWEFSTQMQGGSGKMSQAMAQAQKQMENLPPEQRKMMADMMAKQGIQMGSSGGNGITVKVCMTPEMVERNEVTSHKGECTHNRSPRVGNTMKFSFVCAKPLSSGEGVVTFTSNESYTMQMSTTTTVNGNPEKMDMQSSGRWLDADCGAIKPLMAPK